MIAKSQPNFSLGQFVSTPAALEALQKAGQSAAEFLKRHVKGDWGELCGEDRQAKDELGWTAPAFCRLTARESAKNCGSSPRRLMMPGEEQPRRFCCRANTEGRQWPHAFRRSSECCLGRSVGAVELLSLAGGGSSDSCRGGRLLVIGSLGEKSLDLRIILAKRNEGRRIKLRVGQGFSQLAQISVQLLDS